MDHEDMSTWTDESFEAEIERLRSALAKAESITAEAVAKEAARWLHIVQEAYLDVESVQEYLSDGHEASAKSQLNRAQGKLGIALAKPAPEVVDRLSAHDAELLRPWREAVQDAVDLIDDSGDSLLENMSVERVEATYGGLNALLAPAPAPSSERPECNAEYHADPDHEGCSFRQRRKP